MAELLQTDEQLELLQRAHQRERDTRKAAERLLEDKSRELFESNQRLLAEHKTLKRTQTQLVQSEKMASLGQLAAGIAHEINNPIGYVASNLATLSDYVTVFSNLLNLYNELSNSVRASKQADVAPVLQQIDSIRQEEDFDYILEDVQELLSESADGMVRVRDIVQNLKSFVRLDEASIKEVDLNDSIDSTLKVADNELKYHCEVVRNYGDLPLVHCNAGQLNQVFLNLLMNAAQAMTEQGTITIQTSVDGANVTVRISDNGSGISARYLPRIFDPFFTTKPVGEGTGLGLSVSYNIIEQHCGRITVASEVGVGTEFSIQLPVEGCGSSHK